MKNNHQIPLVSHDEFERELLKDMSAPVSDAGRLPLAIDEFSTALVGVFENNRPVSVELACGKNSTWLPLPASTAELNKALMDIDALDKSYAIKACHTILPFPLENVAVGGNINEINYLAARLAQTPMQEIHKLESLMEIWNNPPGIETLLNFTFNTECFALIPHITTPEELAQYYVFESGLVEMPQAWKNGIDLYDFGLNLEQFEKGRYTDQGYLMYTAKQWERVFENEGIVPEKYQIDNYLKTAEISTEQNYNQIDGVINNEGPRRPDLTDGQTDEEIEELVPSSLMKNAKPSLLGQLQSAKENLADINKTTEKKPSDRER